AAIRRSNSHTQSLAGSAIDRGVSRATNAPGQSGELHRALTLAFTSRVTRSNHPYTAIMHDRTRPDDIRLSAALALVDRDGVPELEPFDAVDLVADPFLAHAVAYAYLGAHPAALIARLSPLTDKEQQGKCMYA